MTKQVENTIISSKVVACVKILEKIRLFLVLASGLEKTITDDVVTLLCVIYYVSQLFHSLE